MFYFLTCFSVCLLLLFGRLVGRSPQLRWAPGQVVFYFSALCFLFSLMSRTESYPTQHNTIYIRDVSEERKNKAELCCRTIQLYFFFPHLCLERGPSQYVILQRPALVLLDVRLKGEQALLTRRQIMSDRTRLANQHALTRHPSLFWASDSSDSFAFYDR